MLPNWVKPLGARGSTGRRRPEGTVLYEAEKDLLATLQAEASETGRPAPVRGEGLLQVPGVRSAGARVYEGALRELQGLVPRRLLVQGARCMPSRNAN
jgi:hypothetical protein